MAGRPGQPEVAEKPSLYDSSPEHLTGLWVDQWVADPRQRGAISDRYIRYRCCTLRRAEEALPRRVCCGVDPAAIGVEYVVGRDVVSQANRMGDREAALADL